MKTSVVKLEKGFTFVESSEIKNCGIEFVCRLACTSRSSARVQQCSPAISFIVQNVMAGRYQSTFSDRFYQSDTSELEHPEKFLPVWITTQFCT
jgi:hypothetical protein